MAVRARPSAADPFLELAVSYTRSPTLQNHRGNGRIVLLTTSERFNNSFPP
jgi:hypothetical protein